MTYTYLLAGENLKLAEAELEGFLKSQGLEPEIRREDRIAFTESEPSQLKRLALTHEVTRLVAETNVEDFEVGYRPESSFAVRVKDFTEEERKEDIEKRLGEKLSTEDNSVDLESPDETVKAYVFEDEVIIGLEVEDIDRGLFEKRVNQERPFSRPLSMDPVLARVLVNLLEVSVGDHILDPMCGTGGILIEAGLCGIGVHGLDIDEEMVEGTRENLEAYGMIAHDIRQGEVKDASEIFDQKFDAVITDLPYGKASKETEEAVSDFLEVKSELTDGRVVFMYNEKEIGGLEADFEIYVHGSLTRYVFVQ